MKWWEILLLIILNAIWIIPMIYELIINPLIELRTRILSNKRWNKENGHKQRKLCIECKYCKCYMYHPFYKYGSYGNYMVTKMPSYCRRFKKHLKSDLRLRCISDYNENAMYE